MTGNYFAETNKLFKMRGIIGRRGFIVNTLVIELIESLIWATPMAYLLMFNPKIWSDFGVFSIQPTLPLWCTLWMAIVGLIISALYYPSIVRRVRDIVGDVDDNRVYMVSSILVVLFFMGYTPVGANYFAKFLSLFILLVLICQKGKITGKKPKSKIYRFNWGACLGTWIWGLFNRAPITILMLPLCLTCGWFPFMLICGIKGNEWALKDKHNKDLTSFHNAQSKQAIVWGILAPFLLFGGMIFFSVGSSIVLYNYTKSHPEYKEKLEELSDEYQKASVEANFVQIDIEGDEYKFYMNPVIWDKLSDGYKTQMINSAANYVYINMKEEGKLLKTSANRYPINIDIMNKTKIYSSFNNELLAEFYLDPKVYNNKLKQAKTFKEKLLVISSGYKINKYPAIP